MTEEEIELRVRDGQARLRTIIDRRCDYEPVIAGEFVPGVVESA